jgi:prefoldin subunit 4
MRASCATPLPTPAPPPPSLRPQNLLAELDDASAELVLLEDDTVRMRLGEAFLHLAPDAAEAALEEHTDAAKERMAELQREQEERAARMKVLKKQLYARFGSSINLEE